MSTLHPVAAAINALRDELAVRLSERGEAVEAAFLAILAKEHVLFYGPPGTAKSLLVESVTDAIIGAKFFATQMHAKKTRDEVEGPVDLLELRNNGNMFRKRTGFITDAHFASIDEIGRISDVIADTMLALLNERRYFEVNGQRSAHDALLYTAFATSNHELAADNDKQAAFADRLLVKTVVDYIEDTKAFAAMLDGPLTPTVTTIDFADLADVVDNVIPAITIHPDAMKAVIGLRKQLRGENIHPSDRRFRNSMKVLRASAFLAGRTEVYEDDLAALRFTLWDTATQRDKVEIACRSVSNPFVQPIMEALSALAKLRQGLRRPQGALQRRDQRLLHRAPAQAGRGAHEPRRPAHPGQRPFDPRLQEGLGPAPQHPEAGLHRRLRHGRRHRRDRDREASRPRRRHPARPGQRLMRRDYWLRELLSRVFGHRPTPEGEYHVTVTNHRRRRPGRGLRRRQR